MELYEYELTQDEIKQLEGMRNAKKAGVIKILSRLSQLANDKVIIKSRDPITKLIFDNFIMEIAPSRTYVGVNSKGNSRLKDTNRSKYVYEVRITLTSTQSHKQIWLNNILLGSIKENDEFYNSDDYKKKISNINRDIEQITGGKNYFH